MQHPFTEMEPIIAAQLNRVQILPGRAARAETIARHLLSYKERYAAVQTALGVVMLFTAPVHERESDADFSTYLGNGDPIDKPSVHVPRGRGPFRDWQSGAIDALILDRINQVQSWTWERLVYEWWCYNGWGPLAHGKQSGYPWGGTNIYDGGKYVRDGVWDSSVWDSQLGCYAIAKAMVNLDQSLNLQRSAVAPAPDDHPAPTLLGIGGAAEDAKTIQTQLNKLNIPNPPLIVDGSFGRKTKAAIITFQERNDLEVDGIAGPKTIEALQRMAA